MALCKWLLPAALLCVAGAANAGSIWDSMGLPSAISGDGPPAGVLAPNAKQGLAGSLALGYIGTTGNTNTSSIDAKLAISYTSGHWFHNAALDRQRVAQDHDLTVNRLDFGGQSNYLFNEHNYVFGHLSYERNGFGGFQQRTSEAIGYGRRILGTDEQTLDIEIGAGWRQSRLRDMLADGQTVYTNKTSGIVRLGGKYEWQFNENGSFGQAIAVEKGSDNTYTESITSLTANLMSTLAVVVSYTIKHNSTVQPGIANTDTYTTVSLQYSF
ncbi:MAG TPA: DUF481 domain-containing protein [Gammaproteobacteria bacterium]|nr:DUF481 domain-containing protein [Gammaproteobacteria bacterium]